MDDYPVAQVRWEGRWIPGHTALIYAIDATDTGIVGPGKIIGNDALGGRPRPDIPLRHPALIEPINCSNLRFEDFSTSYHLMWSLHPTLCRNVTIKNLTIRSTGGNGDGIDIDSCQHVLIDHCDIATGDDCISLKSGRGAEAASQIGINPPSPPKTSPSPTAPSPTPSSPASASAAKPPAASATSASATANSPRPKPSPSTSSPAPAAALSSKTSPATTSTSPANVGGFLRFNILNSGLVGEDPVPGDEGIPTIKKFSFTNIKVDHVPILVDGTGIHPNKPLDGLTLANITGTCAKGIFLANIKNAVIKDVTVTGFTGPLLNIGNVTGKGLDRSHHHRPTQTPRPRPHPGNTLQTPLSIIPQDAQPSVDSQPYRLCASNCERQSSKASSIFPAKKAPYVGQRSSESGLTEHGSE